MLPCVLPFSLVLEIHLCSSWRYLAPGSGRIFLCYNCIFVHFLLYYGIELLNMYWISLIFSQFLGLFTLLLYSLFLFFVSFLIEFERQRMFFSKSKDAANWKQPPILTATVGLPPLRLLPNSTREQDSSPLAWRGMWPSTKISLGAAIPGLSCPELPKEASMSLSHFFQIQITSWWLVAGDHWSQLANCNTAYSLHAKKIKSFWTRLGSNIRNINNE